MQRTRTQVAVAVLFVATSVSQLLQVPGEVLGKGGTIALAAFHAASGFSSLAAAIGMWRGFRGTWIFSLLWGGSTAWMLLSLPRLIQLPAEALAGMRLGAGVAALLSIAGAWYLRREFARER